MIARLTLRGLGPHRSTVLDLDPKGTTPIAGKSEAGKSTLLDGICLALWGLDREGNPLHRSAVNDRATEAEAVIVTGKGTRIRRVVRWDAKEQRVNVRELGDLSYDTDDAMAKALGAAGDRRLRLVLVPMAWRALAESAGEGRELRDLLTGMLPPVDLERVVRELLEARGFPWRPKTPIHAVDAESLRRQAKQRRDELVGRVKAHREGIEIAEADTDRMEVDDVAALRAVVELHRAWVAHERAVAAAQDAARKLEAWQERERQLGPEPTGDVEALKAAEAAHAQAETTRGQRSRELGAATAKLDRAVAALDLARKADQTHPALHYSEAVNAAIRNQQHAGTCPTCRQTWAGAKDAADQRRVEAEAAYQAEADRLATERTETLARLDREVGEAREALRLAQEAADKAGADYVAAGQRLTRARSDNGAIVEWRRNRTLLGARPADPPAVVVAPTEPRPTDEAAEQAAHDLGIAVDAESRRRQRVADLDRLRGLLTQGEGALAEAEGEVARCEALVDVIRRAPSLALAESVAALGDLGPVSVELTEKGGARVLVDGRPWHLASTGRQIVADVWLRAGLRRALRALWFPLVIDQRQSVMGQDCPAPAPAIVLTTTEGELRVSEQRAQTREGVARV